MRRSETVGVRDRFLLLASEEVGKSMLDELALALPIEAVVAFTVQGCPSAMTSSDTTAGRAAATRIATAPPML